ncbi:MAG: transposase [Candidatus Muiribacteriota bacterium]
MARQLRILFKNAFYHIMSRGIRKENIFPDDQHKFILLNYLDKNLIKYNIICYAYCIMDNHYHLFIQTPEANLSNFMRVLNNSYANWYIKKHGVRGAVFAGRYKSIVVDSNNYALTLVNYIHQNPIKKFNAELALSYKHSSLGYYLGIRSKSLQNLNRNFILQNFGANYNDAFVNYSKSLYKLINDKDIKRNVYKKTIIGSKEFVKNIEEKYINKEKNNLDLTCNVDSRPRGYKNILNLICQVTKLNKTEILNKKYNNFYRLLAIKIITEHSRMTKRDIGKIFDIKPNTISGNIANIDKKIKKNQVVKKLYRRILHGIRRKK